MDVCAKKQPMLLRRCGGTFGLHKAQDNARLVLRLTFLHMQFIQQPNSKTMRFIFIPERQRSTVGLLNIQAKNEKKLVFELVVLPHFENMAQKTIVIVYISGHV